MIAEIITSINELFKTLFSALSTSPKNFVIIILLFFTIYALSSNASLVERVPIRNATSVQLQRTIQLNQDVPSILEATRNIVGADRMLLRQFHNGTHSISGVPFLYVVTTHGASDPGQGLSDIEAWQSYPLATMINTISDMTVHGPYDPNCIVVEAENTKDEFYRTYFERYDVKLAIQCPVSNKEGLMVGFVVVHYTKDDFGKDNTELINERLDIVKRAADTISDRLQSDVEAAENITAWYNPITWF